MSPPELPWYRQFWPWFLIALPAAAIAGSLLSVYFALRYPEVIYDPPQPSADSAAGQHHG
jgi:hypothetical protein